MKTRPSAGRGEATVETSGGVAMETKEAPLTSLEQRPTGSNSLHMCSRPIPRYYMSPAVLMMTSWGIRVSVRLVFCHGN